MQTSLKNYNVKYLTDINAFGYMIKYYSNDISEQAMETPLENRSPWQPQGLNTATCSTVKN